MARFKQLQQRQSLGETVGLVFVLMLVVVAWPLNVRMVITHSHDDVGTHDHVVRWSVQQDEASDACEHSEHGHHHNVPCEDESVAILKVDSTTSSRIHDNLPIHYVPLCVFDTLLEAATESIGIANATSVTIPPDPSGSPIEYLVQTSNALLI